MNQRLYSKPDQEPQQERVCSRCRYGDIVEIVSLPTIQKLVGSYGVLIKKAQSQDSWVMELWRDSKRLIVREKNFAVRLLDDGSTHAAVVTT